MRNRRERKAAYDSITFLVANKLRLLTRAPVSSGIVTDPTGEKRQTASIRPTIRENTHLAKCSNQKHRRADKKNCGEKELDRQ